MATSTTKLTHPNSFGSLARSSLKMRTISLRSAQLRTTNNDDEIIIVANIGDSSAIMVTGTEFKVLSVDHVVNAQEKERVERAGGWIENVGGVDRVNGVLAVTRSFGDWGIFEEGLVISEPHVEIIRKKRSKAEEESYIIVASDGLWDVMEFEEAKNILHRMLGNFEVEEFEKLQLASEELTMEAFVRGSKDNIATLVLKV